MELGKPEFVGHFGRNFLTIKTIWGDRSRRVGRYNLPQMVYLPTWTFNDFDGTFNIYIYIIFYLYIPIESMHSMQWLILHGIHEWLTGVIFYP